MTFPFNEKVINDEAISRKSFKYPNFIGFLNPYGVPISFKDDIGYVGHGTTPSVLDCFRIYYILKIKDSKWSSDFEQFMMSEEQQRSDKEYYLEKLKKMRTYLKNDLEYEKKFSPAESNYLLEMQAKLDVYQFLINCYNAETFFDGVGNVETCKCKREFWITEYKHKDRYDIDDWQFDIVYERYKKKLLIDSFKNVMIQNLGYHSVERVPKTITTSSFRIYETFYNYLLNDFTIFQLPKMIYDSEKRKYVKQTPNEFFLPDSELILKKEIQAIKRRVPIKERAKYYR